MCIDETIDQEIQETDQCDILSDSNNEMFSINDSPSTNSDVGYIYVTYIHVYYIYNRALARAKENGGGI